MADRWTEYEGNFSYVGKDFLSKEVEKRLINNQQEVKETKNLTVVLFGKTGQGKSSTGNFLLGEKRFSTGFGQKSETQITKAEEILVGNLQGLPKIQLKIIDTPGLFDQPEHGTAVKDVKRQIKDAKKVQNNDAKLKLLEDNLHRLCLESEKARDIYLETEIQKCIAVCGSGVDAFLLVMKCDSRFDRDSKKALELIVEKFGASHLYNYLFLVFTHEDSLHLQKITPEDFLKNHLHEDTEYFLDDIGNKHCFINNMLLETAQTSRSSRVLDKERENVLKSIMDNVKRNNNLRYTSRHFAVPEMKRIKGLVKSASKNFEKLWLQTVNEYQAIYIKSLPPATWKTAAKDTLNVVTKGSIDRKFQKKLLEELVEKNATFVVFFMMTLHELQKQVTSLKLEYWPAILAEKQKMQAVKAIQNAAIEVQNFAIDDSEKLKKKYRAIVLVLSPIVIPIYHAIIKGEDIDSEGQFKPVKDKCIESLASFREEAKSIIEEIEEFCKNPSEACSCLICLDVWKDPIICPQSMKHVGCRSCIEDWLRQNPTCPICKCDWSL